MTVTTQAPAPEQAPEVSHTHRGLNPQQIHHLLRPIHPSRIKRDNKGMSHVEAWDIRRTLNRFFGFTNWSYTTHMDLVREIEHAGGGRPRWTVVYRAKVRLTICDQHGNTLAHYEEYAAGDAQNQPSLGDAHDMAMKTAESQALKRAAVNLGDGFGLSLYNDGSPEAVVNATLTTPPATAA